MKINLITNATEAKGLALDGILLEQLLTKLGHEVSTVDFRGGDIRPADLNIFCEVAIEHLFKYASTQWLIPNLEWLRSEYEALLPRFDRVLCKTKDAARVLAHKCNTSVFTGFYSRDLYREDISRERKFLHLAGGSIIRGTDEVLAAWNNYDIPYPLTVISKEYEGKIRNPRITHRRRIDDEQLYQLMNSHLFHLLPTSYEGYGHALHEAMGVKAGAIITTDAPPMNEFGCSPKSLLLPSVSSEPLMLARAHKVSPSAIRDAVETTWAMNDEELSLNGEVVRRIFERERVDFAISLERLLGEVKGGIPEVPKVNVSTTLPENLPDLYPIRKRYNVPADRNKCYQNEVHRDMDALHIHLEARDAIIAAQQKRILELIS